MRDVWRPSACQTLLLSAVLRPRAEALTAWRDWVDQTVLEDIEGASQLLLPLLYDRLRRWGVQEPVMERYHAVHRYWMLRNTRTRQRVGDLVQALQRRGVQRVLVQGGAAVIGHLYNSPANRPVGKTSLIVAPSDRSRAMDLATDLGAEERIDDPASWLQWAACFARGRLRLRTPTGDLIEIAWDVSAPASGFGEVWERSTPLEANVPAVRRLPPETRLVRALARAVRADPKPKLFWITDTLRSLEREEVDWDAACQQAATQRCAGRVATGLRYLAESWGADVPPSVLNALSQVPASREDRAYATGRVPLSQSRPIRVLRRVARTIKRDDGPDMSR